MMGLCCANLKGNVAPLRRGGAVSGHQPAVSLLPHQDPPAGDGHRHEHRGAGQARSWRRSWASPFPRAGRWTRTADPTTDPAAGPQGGCLLPIGGAKGSGLAIMVDMCSAASSHGGRLRSTHLHRPLCDGPSPQGVGHLHGRHRRCALHRTVQAFKAKALAAMSAEIKALKKARRRAGDSSCPANAGGRQAREANAANGIEVAEPVYRGAAGARQALRPEPVKEEASWQKFSSPNRSTPSDPSC